jgi:PEP-CTERM motif
MKLSISATTSMAAGMLAFFGVATGGVSWAAPVILDPNFAVCNATTSGACSADPNQIGTSGSFNAFVIGNAGAGPLNPFLILVAVPDLPKPPLSGAPGTSPVFTSSASITLAPATSAQYGQTNVPNAVGYLGELNSGAPSNCSDLYCFAGLTGGNNSMNFANFTLPEENTLLGVTPTSFSVYEFTATVAGTGTGSNLGDGTVYNIPYTSTPLGSYVAAYGIETFPLPTKGGVEVYASPFTTSGWATGGPPKQLPEPESIALMGLGMLVLAATRRKCKA